MSGFGRPDSRWARAAEAVGYQAADAFNKLQGDLRFSDHAMFAEHRVRGGKAADSWRLEVRCPAAYPDRSGRDALTEHIVPAWVRSTAIRPWTMGGTSWQMTTGQGANRTL